MTLQILKTITTIKTIDNTAIKIEFILAYDVVGTVEILNLIFQNK